MPSIDGVKRPEHAIWKGHFCPVLHLQGAYRRRHDVENGRQAACDGLLRQRCQVLLIIEAFDPIATWSSFSNGSMLAHCSCSGVLCNGRLAFTGVAVEYLQMQAALGRSSTCRHAAALVQAYDATFLEVRA